MNSINLSSLKLIADKRHHCTHLYSSNVAFHLCCTVALELASACNEFGSQLVLKLESQVPEAQFLARFVDLAR